MRRVDALGARPSNAERAPSRRATRAVILGILSGFAGEAGLLGACSHFSDTLLVGLLAGVCLATGGCAHPAEPDAYGNVEATEVVVGAEGSGQLISFAVTEGQTLAATDMVGAIDPTELGLQREQLAAQRAAGASRVREVGHQIEVVQAQRAAAIAQRDAARAERAGLVAQQEIAHRARERTERLFAQQAATAQQRDQAEKDDRVLANQIQAQDQLIEAHEQQIASQTEQIALTRTERQTATEHVASADAAVAQAGERIRKSQIRNPIAGTVLATYAKAGEVVQAGQPLYKIANLDQMEVRAWVREPQLAHLRLGQAVHVSIDVGTNQRRMLAGALSWVSSQAEFTPTPIQTRDERAGLVYAIKIRVPNEGGLLKIGMPADVRFVATSGAP